MLFYRLKEERFFGKGIDAIRIFDKGCAMTEIEYKNTIGGIQIVRTTHSQVAPDQFEVKTYRWDKITAEEAKPIILAWTQLGCDIANKIRKAK